MKRNRSTEDNKSLEKNVDESVALYPEVYAEWAPNEKVAMESAFGAALSGVRSFCGMKHVGLNVAADPLFTISYTGINAGMVIAVADDPGMHSSQNEQDSRHYAKAAKLPMLEPADSAEAKDYAILAYELSEKFDTPVMLRMCTRVSHSRSLIELAPRKELEPKAYEKTPSKYIMMPANAKRRHPIVEERTAALSDWASESGINKAEEGKDSSRGIICTGTVYQYVKEAVGDKYPVLKLGMVNPLPEKLIKSFAEKVGELIVIEELDPFIEEYVKSIGLSCKGKELFTPLGEFSVNYIAQQLGQALPQSVSYDGAIPGRPPVMCSGCPHRGIYYVLKKLGLHVLGDIGCYTLGAAQPLNALDTTICMGASVSGLHGFNKAGGARDGKKAVGVIGDSTFMHSGITGLVNIAYNESDSTVIILDNSITGMTGHQQNPTTGFNLKGDPCTKIDLEALCRAVGIKRVRVVDPYDLKQCEEVVKEEVETAEPSVIISRRPCALLKYVKHPGPISIDKDKCVGCKACMKIGCPSISLVDGKAEIDRSQCVGCGVCKALCKKDAIG